jgi:hypothetical protein
MRILSIVFLFLIWGICCSILPNPTIRGIFGVKIGVQATGQLYFLQAFINNGRTITHQRLLTKDEFTKFASGYWPSIYNPNRFDYLHEYKLYCGLALDTASQQKHCYCLPLDSLWKIRFSNFPFNNNSETGWSRLPFKPSASQEEYLKDRYNVNNLNVSYFIDEKFWLLLKDVQDPIWVKQYKSL